MKRETEIKSGVLQQLIEAMLGETGGKMKPKMVTIEVVKPMEKGEGSLEEVLDKASKKDSDDEWEGSPEDEALDKLGKEAMEEDDDEKEMCEGGEMKKPRMSLSQFLSRK